MLESLTRVALSRGWKPSVYVRLVTQLDESLEENLNEKLFPEFSKMIKNSPLNPLLFEYILSFVTADKTNAKFIEFFKSIAESETDFKFDCFMAYSFRKIRDLDYIDLADKLKSKVVSLPSFASGTWNLNMLSNISVSRDSSDQIFQAGGRMKSIANVDDNVDADILFKSTSMTFYELLYWMLSKGQDVQELAQFINEIWPSQGNFSLYYNLINFSFLLLANCTPRFEGRCEKFITTKLPLILKSLSNDPFDSVLVRVFTTMDKELVTLLDQKYSNVRYVFGSACIELGLCHASVVHNLHRNYVLVEKQSPPGLNLENLNDLISDLHEMKPLDAERVSNDILKLVETNPPSILNVCMELSKNFASLDSFSVHISLINFCSLLTNRLEMLAVIENKESLISVYDEIGHIFSLLYILKVFYQVDVVSNCLYVHKLVDLDSYINLSLNNVGQSMQRNVSKWVVCVFSGTNKNKRHTLEMLLPYNQLQDTLVVMLKQAIWAYRSAVLDGETYRKGLDYLTHQLPANLTIPIIFRTFVADILEGKHQAATVEGASIFLRSVASKRGLLPLLLRPITWTVILRFASLANNAGFNMLVANIKTVYGTPIQPQAQAQQAQQAQNQQVPAQIQQPQQTLTAQPQHTLPTQAEFLQILDAKIESVNVDPPSSLETSFYNAINDMLMWNKRSSSHGIISSISSLYLQMKTAFGPELILETIPIEIMAVVLLVDRLYCDVNNLVDMIKEDHPVLFNNIEKFSKIKQKSVAVLQTHNVNAVNVGENLKDLKDTVDMDDHMFTGSSEPVVVTSPQNVQPQSQPIAANVPVPAPVDGTETQAPSTVVPNSTTPTLGVSEPTSAPAPNTINNTNNKNTPTLSNPQLVQNNLGNNNKGNVYGDQSLVPDLDFFDQYDNDQPMNLDDLDSAMMD